MTIVDERQRRKTEYGLAQRLLAVQLLLLLPGPLASPAVAYFYVPQPVGLVLAFFLCGLGAATSLRLLTLAPVRLSLFGLLSALLGLTTALALAVSLFNVRSGQDLESPLLLDVVLGVSLLALIPLSLVFFIQCDKRRTGV